MRDGAHVTGRIVNEISPQTGRVNEEGVADAEKRFALFLDHLPSFAWMKDLEGRYVYVNKLLSEMPEYRRGWLGKTDAELWPAELAAQYSANDQKVIATRQQLQMVENFLAEGQTHYILVNKFPILGESGAATMVGGTGLDITDRIRTETQLEEAQQLANLGSWDWDIRNDKLIWSNELFHIFGLAPAKFAGSDRTFLDRLHPDDRERTRACITAAIEKREPYNLELRIVRPDGSVRTLHSRGRVSYDAAGKPIRMFGVAQDITHRIEAGEALRKSERRFRQLADNIREVFWINNFTTRRTEYVNRAFEKTWKRSTESVMAGPDVWMEAIHPDDRERVAKEFDDRATDRGYDSTYRIVWPDGTIRWIHDRGFPVRDEDGRSILLVGIAEDVTNQKNSEEQLRAAHGRLQILSRRFFEVQEAERRHLARELHDQIGQALTAAKINTDMLRATAPAEMAARLQENAAILEGLLQQTRRISLDLRPPLLDDLGLVPALCWYVDQQAERAGLQAKFLPDPLVDDVPAHIETACFRLAQEAITNVVRHSRAKKLTVKLERADNSLRLLVRDDGAGFDAIKADARAAHGASLGLLGMKERAALAGGTAEIVSSPGQGTTVEVSLPLDGSGRSGRT
ncbi:MAG: hypothetical protein QOG27_685 [Verrucomicrobiota bacterium]